MTHGASKLAIPVLLTCPALLAGAEVTERNGNIFLRQENGSIRQLTAKGIDYDPALSCDGKALVFVRRAPFPNRSSFAEELGSGDGNELWIASLNAPEEARKVFGGDQKHAGWFGFGGPRFSADGQRLYFLRWFGNGSSMYELTIQTGEARRLVLSARALWPVCDGVFKDSVVVQEDHLQAAGGHIDLHWLFDSQGRRSELVGTTREQVARFFGLPLNELK